jgi:hypothetical protein
METIPMKAKFQTGQDARECLSRHTLLKADRLFKKLIGEQRFDREVKKIRRRKKKLVPGKWTS